MKYTLGQIIEEAKIIDIKDFGAFVKIGQFQDGLIHFSQVVPRVERGNVGNVLSIGDKVRCAVSEIKPNGKVSLTMRIRKRIERRHQVEQVKKDIANMSDEDTSLRSIMDGADEYSTLYVEVYAVGNSIEKRFCLFESQR